MYETNITEAEGVKINQSGVIREGCNVLSKYSLLFLLSLPL